LQGSGDVLLPPRMNWLRPPMPSAKSLRELHTLFLSIANHFF
jgi:hypothetical protein